MYFHKLTRSRAHLFLSAATWEAVQEHIMIAVRASYHRQNEPECTQSTKINRARMKSLHCTTKQLDLKTSNSLREIPRHLKIQHTRYYKNCFFSKPKLDRTVCWNTVSIPHMSWSFRRSFSLWYWFMNCRIPCFRTWSAYFLVSSQLRGEPSVRSPIVSKREDYVFRAIIQIIRRPVSCQPKIKRNKLSRQRLYVLCQSRHQKTTCIQSLSYSDDAYGITWTLS